MKIEYFKFFLKQEISFVNWKIFYFCGYNFSNEILYNSEGNESVTLNAVEAVEKLEVVYQNHETSWNNCSCGILSVSETIVTSHFMLFCGHCRSCHFHGTIPFPFPSSLHFLIVRWHLLLALHHLSLIKRHSVLDPQILVIQFPNWRRNSYDILTSNIQEFLGTILGCVNWNLHSVINSCS